MHLLERVPQELTMTAIHEAGHALSCLLVDCRIECWQILGKDAPVRMNRRLRHMTNNPHDGRGCIFHDPTAHELSIALAGDASEGREVFIPNNVSSAEELVDLYGEHTDQYVAWLLAQHAHVECGDEVSNTEIARRIQLTYGKMLDLFNQEHFEAASCSLARYMLERGAEDDDVNNRMLRFLDAEGFTKNVRAHMRSQFVDIRLPFFEASDAEKIV